MRRTLLIASAVALAACGQNALTSGDMGSQGQPDMAMAFSGDMAGTSTQELTIGPIPLSAGEEKTVCSIFRLGNAQPMDVIRIASTLAPGSHHLILYKTSDTTENKGPFPCEPLNLGQNQSEFIPLYIAETEKDNTLPLPSGVAYELDANQMVKLEAHYLNATPNMVNGMGDVTLTIGPPATYQPADIMFCGSVTPLLQNFPNATGVPPGPSTLPAGFYKVNPSLKIFGLTTHEHKRGTLMTVDKSTSTAPGTNLTMGTPYDNPPFVTYDDQHLLTFQPGEGLRWQCSYNNPDNMTYWFGQSAQDNEMCFLWAYYFPSVGHFISLECQQ